MSRAGLLVVLVGAAVVACQYTGTRDDAAALLVVWTAEYKDSTSNRTQAQ